ncbi:MAG: guanylate kinase [Acidobacteria bacterium]|nr:guanylate kinase [Acidobacteriota bacterium]
MERGSLFILSAPSGAGKSTVIRELLGQEMVPTDSLRFSISHTTRPARRGETNGKDYHFVDEGRFHAMAEAGEFLEWARVHGNLYGTSRGAVEPFLARGIDMLLEIDVQGAEQVMERADGAYGVFLVPPSYAELERRLRGRGLDEASVVARRLAVSAWEIKRYVKYDYVIINLDAALAARALAAIILEKRYQRQRRTDEVEAILADFPAEDC